MQCYMRTIAACAAAGVVLVGLSATSHASIVGPYAADANTLHLYHLDDSGLPGTDSASVPLHLMGPTGNTTTTTPAGFQGPVFGAAAYTGFGTSANFANDALSVVSSGNPPTVAPHRPVLSAAAGLSNTGADDVTLDWAGADGAFTMEAVIRFNPNVYDPTSNAFRTAAPTAAPGTNAGQYPMEIISGEGDSNGRRLFQFRIDQIGFGGANTVGPSTGNTQPRLEFANLRGIVSNQGIVVNLPTTGQDAINNTDWFHVAIAYNGAQGTADNIAFYWTKLDESYTEAHLLATAQLNLDPVEGLTGFALGNETRDVGTGAGEGESFPGWIDEVRISDIARGPGQFIFIPEPASALALLMLGGLAVARRRS
jgi:hypothetical protein